MFSLGLWLTLFLTIMFVYMLDRSRTFLLEFLFLHYYFGWNYTPLCKHFNIQNEWDIYHNEQALFKKQPYKQNLTCVFQHCLMGLIVKLFIKYKHTHTHLQHNTNTYWQALIYNSTFITTQKNSLARLLFIIVWFFLMFAGSCPDSGRLCQQSKQW